MRIEIIRNNEVIASSQQEKETYLVFQQEYQESDRIVFTPERAGYVTLQFDAVLGRSTLYTDGSAFSMDIPFAQKHECYQESVFKGAMHFLWVREAYGWEYNIYRNLALNPYDCHENTSFQRTSLKCFHGVACL